jgi:hypothetical protein
MKPMPPELAAELQKIVPNFVRLLERVSEEGRDIPVILTVDAFAGEPELFYACAAYASEQGVALWLAPKNKSDIKSDATS